MPDFPIVDAPVHLHDPGVIRYGWMREKPGLDPPHDLAEFDQARGPVEARGIVWIEVGAAPGQHRSEARRVADLAAREPRSKGMVAHPPLENGAAARGDSEQLLEHGQLKGIRCLLQDEPDNAFCRRSDFVAGLRLGFYRLDAS